MISAFGEEVMSDTRLRSAAPSCCVLSAPLSIGAADQGAGGIVFWGGFNTAMELSTK